MPSDNNAALTSRSSGAADNASAAPTYFVGDISVTDLRKSFGVTRALDGCTFNAKLGEIHAVVGENGCGKSTLAKVISGVLPIDSGQISILGHTPLSPQESRSIGIATVFQEILVADECSVVDNLFLGSDSLWSKTASTRDKVRTARSLMTDLVGSDIDPETLVGGLPLSVKQWITIGRALLCKPRILILDESSAALDFDSTERLFRKMRELRDQGAAVLIITHRIAELIRVSDRATVLRDGRDVGVLTGREITERNLIRLMTGKAERGGTARTAAPGAAVGDVVLKASKLKVWPSSAEIDFELARGEIVGVTGLDGQGQSEFVGVLAGIQPASQSVPLIRSKAGEFVELRGLSDADKHGVAYVSGDRKREGVFANLNIFENLTMPLYRRSSRLGRIALIDWTTLSGVFDFEIERLSIKLGHKTDGITSLSGGNQQKVLIGRSFALNPDVLVLNDPARGVDVGAKDELYKHLKAYASRGKAIVYLSTEIEEFIGFCSRVLVFRHGSVYDAFAGSAIDTVRILEAMFGQTKGLQRQEQAANRTTERRHMKIIDFDKETEKGRTITKNDIGPIKIRDFDKEQDQAASPVPAERKASSEPRMRPAVGLIAPSPMKIVDFDKEAQERDLRSKMGRIKIIDFDKESDRQKRLEKESSKRGVRSIKIVEFNG